MYQSFFDLHGVRERNWIIIQSSRVKEMPRDTKVNSAKYKGIE